MLIYLSFPRHPVYYHIQLPSPRHEHTWRSHVRACCARPLTSRGGRTDRGVRERGLFVERIFSAHPLAGITVRINSQQKYARYFHRPDENLHASARRKKGKRGGCVCPAMRDACFAFGSRAPNIRSDELSPPGEKVSARVLFAPRHRVQTNRVSEFTCNWPMSNSRLTLFWWYVHI